MQSTALPYPTLLARIKGTRSSIRNANMASTSSSSNSIHPCKASRYILRTASLLGRSRSTETGEQQQSTRVSPMINPFLQTGDYRKPSTDSTRAFGKGTQCHREAAGRRGERNNLFTPELRPEIVTER